MRKVVAGAVLGFVLFPAPLFALITISLDSVSGSIPLVGSGTPTAVLNFGNVSAFEPVAAGATRTLGASNYSLATDFGVRVTQILGGSASYTLQARLQNASTVAWTLDGVTLSMVPATVATLQPYAANIPHTLSFVVPFSHAAGAVNAVLEITAIAN